VKILQVTTLLDQRFWSICGIILTHFKPRLYYKLEQETSSFYFGPFIIVASSGISWVLEYSSRSSTECSNSKKLDSHSPSYNSVV